MAIIQIGYLGGTGPVFTDDSPGGGKKYLYQGGVYNGVMKLRIVQPAFAPNLKSSYVASDYTLGSYSDLQVIGDAPAYTQPATGANFQGYQEKASDWVTATSVTGNVPIQGNISTGGNTTTTTTTTGGGTTTTGGGTTTTGGDTTFSAPTIMEQVQTFLSNYWWLVLLIVGVLLWKPIIAPALGMGKRKRSYR